MLVGSTAINQALKFLIKRERPLSRLIDEGGFSYPSGHTMAAVSLYGIITFILWRHVKTSTRRVMLIVFSCFMIIFIAISRIYLGVHYTTDILGAFLVSGTWLYVTIWLYQYRIEKKHEE
ncbi:phosphatase PAP2 family protein [Anaerobacillus sp. CMMVII]|uniref:phosphatase PAP2 family protein n=1 Tax=Anaerobacillus sp. CMMVII TaxID=2755588 RepID=UPI0021B8182A|nr:phosphatase PAP2 family protein [Anaerobacillus sp. CMMVII]MCT8140277.1 phosphatase PAP2 family protein [Anaerobacillus sp. CMMVII]